MKLIGIFLLTTSLRRVPQFGQALKLSAGVRTFQTCISVMVTVLELPRLQRETRTAEH